MRSLDQPGYFDRLVADAWARIPARFRSRMKNIAFLVADEPSRSSSPAAGSPAETPSSASTKVVP